MRIAVSSAQALLVVLMLRVASPAARASAPTWSTPGQAVQEAAQRRLVAGGLVQRGDVAAERPAESRTHALSL